MKGTACRWIEHRDTNEGAATVVQMRVGRTRVLQEERAVEDSSVGDSGSFGENKVDRTHCYEFDWGRGWRAGNQGSRQPQVFY